MSSKQSGSFVPVILAGGSGTRLWPLSRREYPKQFLALGGEQSLLQETVHRARQCNGGTPVVVASEPHRFLVAEQMAAIGESSATILLEPSARNTAPAIAAAAHRLAAEDPDAVMLVMPADHQIQDQDAFAKVVDTAVAHAREGHIVLLGIDPVRPETGYGYITASGADAKGVRSIDAFVEKPDAARAGKLIDAGNCYWNSGMFVFTARRFLESLSTLEPDMHAATAKAVASAQEDLDFLRLDADAFAACRSVAVDVAVMERISDAKLVPFSGGWSDVGSWDAVHALSPQDADANATEGDVSLHASKSCYVRSESRLVVGLGLENIIVIETPDVVLVLQRDHAQSLKEALAHLEADGRTELSSHTTVYRPWGHYESLKVDGRFQVKRITVKPGAILSLQKHFHRAEHWVVVKGTAEVTCDDTITMLSENESIYLPLGCVHRMHNPGRIPLEIIEVQTGSYLGEDDIVRLGDEYGRG